MICLRISLIAAACGLCVPAQTTLKGCLTGDARQFYFHSVKGQQFYAITGNTNGLAANVNHEIEVLGDNDLSAKPWPTFRVNKLLEVFKIPLPSLNSSFTDKATWRIETDQARGIKFARPTLTAKLPAGDDSYLPSNFTADKSVAPIGRFELPSKLYPNSNFVGGEFAIFVDPHITTAKGCRAFKDDDPRFRSSSTIAGVHYVTTQNGGAAAGTWSSREYLHAFQNGQCYELGFVFLESTIANYPLGCLVAALREQDKLKIVQELLNAVSFLAP